VSAWLRNPRNAGIVTYKGSPVAESAAIIDRGTWDRVQALLADPARAPRKGRPNSTLLGGLLTCGTCGKSLKPSSNSDRRGRFPTYTCEPARHVTQSRDRLDAMLRDLIAGYIHQNADVVRAMLDTADGVAPLRAQAADLRAQLDALAGLLAVGQVQAADFAAATSAVRARLDTIEEQAAAVSGSEATVRLLALADPGQAVRDLDPVRFRAVFRELIASAVLHPAAAGGGLDVTWRA
jgi:hypothetical protein